MTQPVRTQNVFVPAPVDGLNLIDPPALISPTEAKTLDEYLVFDWGIRQRQQLYLEDTMSGTIGTLYEFIDAKNSFKDSLVICANSKFYVKPQAGTAPSEVTLPGAVTIATDNWSICTFNKHLFLVADTNDPLRYRISDASIIASPFTGANRFRQMWAYKRRMYGIEYLTTPASRTVVWYSALDAVTGALAGSFDFSLILDSSADLLFGTAWTVNQGTNNEELFVVCSTIGEIVIYSGDNPAATNWSLVGRTKIPTPISKRSFVKLGNDILVHTKRGVVSLLTVLQHREGTSSYYAVSRKIGEVLNKAEDYQPALHSSYPFVFFADDLGGVWVENYERGAWSRFNLFGSITPQMCVVGTDLYLTNGSTKLYRIPDNGLGVDTAYTYKWHTPYVNHGTNQNKQVMFLRNQVRNVRSFGGSATNSLGSRACVATEFTDSQGTFDSAVESATGATDTKIRMHQIAPPGAGTYLSYQFEETPTGAHYSAEMLGFQTYFEVGGL